MKRSWWKLSRRALLRGAGASIALPFLDVMAPQGSRSMAAGPSARRMVFIWGLPTGVLAKKDPLQGCAVAPWTPAGASGPLLNTGEPYLKPFFDRGVASKLTVLTGLSDRAGAGNHMWGCAAFLGSTRPTNLNQDSAPVVDVGGTTADQILAAHLKPHTPQIPSLVVGSAISGASGHPYKRHISWHSGTEPVAKDINPRTVFERLFGAGINPTDAAAIRRQLYRKSVLDSVRGDAEALKRRLGASDQRKITQYLDSIRQIEQQMDRGGTAACPNIGAAPAEPDEPYYANENLPTRVRVMIDLIAKALECDRTRVVSYMMVNAYGLKSYPHLAIPEWHHTFSHYDQAATPELALQWKAWIDKYTNWALQIFAEFLEKLDAAKEGEGSVLDNSLVYFSGEDCEAALHSCASLPILLAGRGGKNSSSAWNFNAGRHVRFPRWDGRDGSYPPYPDAWETGGPALNLQGTPAYPGPLNPGERSVRDLLWGILRLFEVPNISAYGDATAPLDLRSI
jgi:hypothetical protein